MANDELVARAESDGPARVNCVNCMAPANSLYTKYSKDVIRITECEKCREFVDKYVEYDIVLVFIDLILQYASAYRHLLLHVKFESYHRLAAIFLLCDAYDKWIERRAHELTDSSRIYDLEWKFYESLTQSTLEMAAYTMTILLLVWMFGLEQRVRSPWKQRSTMGFLVVTTLMGFYGNILVVFSIVWKLHQHLIHRCLSQLFLAISHVQVQHTLVDAGWVANTAMVMTALCVQKAVGYAANATLVHLSEA